VRIPEEDSNLGLEVKKIPGKDRGVVATRTFSKGEILLEYSGDLLTSKQWREKEKIYKQKQNLGSYVLKFKNLGQTWYIDATQETNKLGRLVNHTRINPNCYLKKIIIDNVPRIFLVAKYEINCGDELSYDYGDRDPASFKYFPWLSKIKELKTSKNQRGKPAEST
jgi:histone-lysine N-methyltransferase SETD8